MQKELQNKKQQQKRRLIRGILVDALYKTNLCRQWMATHTCRYEDKCRFAHGIAELRVVEHDEMLKHVALPSKEKVKTLPCQGWVACGFCPYMTRCCFLHDPRLAADSKTRSHMLKMMVAHPDRLHGKFNRFALWSTTDVYYWPETLSQDVYNPGDEVFEVEDIWNCLLDTLENPQVAAMDGYESEGSNDSFSTCSSTSSNKSRLPVFMQIAC